jgi:proteasome alpha subunit
MKPYEVEILVAQVGADQEHDELFHILYDGTVMDEIGFTVLGGQADSITDVARQEYRTDLDLRGAVRLGARLLAADGEPLAANQLEVAFLERSRTRRAFERVRGDQLAALLAD